MSLKVPSNVQKKNQRNHYSGKKKRHTVKTQVLLDLTTHQVVSLAFAEGHCHDFTLFKASLGVSLPEELLLLVDLGYLGILNFHENTFIPAKSSKNHALNEAEKSLNHEIAIVRIEIEHFNAVFKTFKSWHYLIGTVGNALILAPN